MIEVEDSGKLGLIPGGKLKDEYCRILRKLIEHGIEPALASEYMLDKVITWSQAEKEEGELDYEVVFYSGGLGDYFSVMSHMSPEQRSQIKLAYLHTPAADYIKEIAPFQCEILSNSIVYHRAEAEVEFGKIDAKDLSISKVFKSHPKFYGFDFTNFPKKQYLDKPYTFVTPKSENVSKGRNLTWDELDYIAENFDNPIAFYHRPLSLPFPCVSLCLFDTIGYLQGASVFVGVDSAMACLAGQIFDQDHLLIKSVNQHYYRWKHIYCAPHKQFKFIKENLC